MSMIIQLLIIITAVLVGAPALMAVGYLWIDAVHRWQDAEANTEMSLHSNASLEEVMPVMGMDFPWDHELECYLSETDD